MTAKILIVDDAPDTVQMLAAWLRESGYETTGVGSGQEALAVAADEHPDLILLDVAMPSLDGIETCRRLRADPATSDIPVILVTAQDPTRARAEGLLAGAVDYITKPVNLLDLRDRVAAVLQAGADYRPDTARLLDELVHSALAILPCDFAWLLALDPQGHALESRAFACAGGAEAKEAFADQAGGQAAATFQIPLLEDGSPLVDVMSAHRALLDVPLKHFQQHAGTQVLYQALQILDLQYISLVPLAVAGRMVGLLLLGTANRTELDSPRGWQLLTALSSQAAITLDYTHLAQNLVEQEEMIAIEQAFLQMILDSMGDGLVVIGEDAQIEYVNNRLLRMTGYTRSEVFGQEVGMLFHPDDREQLLYSLRKGPGSTMKFDQRLLTKTGEHIPVLLSRSSFANIDPDAHQQVLVVSDLTEQKHREEALERQGQQLRALNRAAGAITSTLSPHEVITQILKAAVEMTTAEGASILLRNAEHPDELRFVAAVGPMSDTMYGLRVPIGQGIAGWVAREARSQLVPDTNRDERFYRNIDRSTGLTTRSLIAVPLIVSDRVIGVLEVVNKLEGTFDQVDVELLESIAGTAAIAIQNARLFDQTRRRLNELGTLLDASAAVSSTLDFGSVLELIARRLVDSLQVERCLITAWDRQSNTLNALAEVTDAYWPPGTGPVRSLQHLPQWQQTLQSGRPIVAHIHDSKCDPAARAELHESGQRAMIGLPLRVAGKFVGLVVLYSNLTDHAFGKQDAVQIARTIKSWHDQLGADGASVWQKKETIKMLCDRLLLIPGVTWVMVEAWDAAQKQTRRLCETGFSLWTDQVGTQQHLSELPMMTRVLTIGQAKVASLSGLDSAVGERRLLERTGGQVVLIAPLMVRGQPEGLVVLLDTDEARRFDNEEIALCQGIANVVGNAMENAQLYQSLERRAEALEEAYAELKQADQLKDELLQNLSHELQTPLLHVLGYLELLHNGDFGPLNPEQREKVAFVLDRAQHLSELVKDIIAVQSLQEQKIERRPIDLAGLIQRSLHLQRAEADRHSIRLDVDIPPDLSPVMAEPQMLSDAFEQLLDNAIKFSPQGGRVTVSVIDGGAVLEVHVRDQGIGIPESEQERIFERFYQVDGAATRRFGGTGLGLAIVREIIQQHGGRVWVKSKPGQGSTFAFTVPKAPVKIL